MLKRQKHKAQFTGGLEAARLKDWHVELLYDLKPEQIFFAYDTEDDYEPLQIVSKKLKLIGFTRHQMRCSMLIGYPKDTFDKAENRLDAVVSLGFYPMAMLYRDKTGNRDPEWMRFQRKWARPAAIYMNYLDKQDSHSVLFP